MISTRVSLREERALLREEKEKGRERETGEKEKKRDEGDRERGSREREKKKGQREGVLNSSCFFLLASSLCSASSAAAFTIDGLEDCVRGLGLGFGMCTSTTCTAWN